MESLTSHHVSVLFLALAVLIGMARLLGEIAQKVHQPAVIGELLAGVLLGPTLLGRLAPGLNSFLFPLQGANAIALDGIASLAIALFLLVAGMEVDLSTVWKQGRIGLKVGIASIVIPFAIAFAAAWTLPDLLGRHAEADPMIFALFLAIAIAISALPIIAKTMMDLGLYRSDFGMVVVSAAVLNDVVGWIVFAVILGLIGDPSGNGNAILMTVVLTLAFAATVLTVGRALIHRALPYVQAYTHWPGGELSFALVLGLLGAAFTEWIGIHAIFGTFVAGVAIGDSAHLRERTRVIIDKFVAFIFAPVFFASIGLRVDFLAYFDPPLVLAVLLTACGCKVAGGVLGARWGGMSSRESWGVGFAMVSVGAMGIIVGMIALKAGIIHPQLFVALIVMAMATSMLSGPALRVALRAEKSFQLQDVLSPRRFIGALGAASRREAIRELVATTCPLQDLDCRKVEDAVWSREEALSTGIGNSVAIPHARIHGLRRSIVTVGLSSAGIDFDAPDGKPARVVFLILTADGDPGAQLDIVAEIARLFRDPRRIDGLERVENFTDFLALVRAGS